MAAGTLAATPVNTHRDAINIGTPWWSAAAGWPQEAWLPPRLTHKEVLLTHKGMLLTHKGMLLTQVLPGGVLPLGDHRETSRSPLTHKKGVMLTHKRGAVNTGTPAVNTQRGAVNAINTGTLWVGGH